MSSGKPVAASRFGLSELVKQAALIGCAVLFYFAVRGQTEGAEATAIDNGRALLQLEQSLGIAVERPMQEWVEANHLTTLANWVYIWCHWPAIIGVLVWLHHTRIESYLLLRNAMFISGSIGLCFFVTLPAAPPRLIEAGFTDTVTEYSTSYRVLQPPALVNKYAALPSLHVGWNLLLGLALYQASERRAVRFAAVSGPLLMGLAVVVTANHYLVDGVVGSAVALLGLWGSRRITRPLIDLERKLRGTASPVDATRTENAVEVSRR